MTDIKEQNKEDFVCKDEFGIDLTTLVILTLSSATSVLAGRLVAWGHEAQSSEYSMIAIVLFCLSGLLACISVITHKKGLSDLFLSMWKTKPLGMYASVLFGLAITSAIPYALVLLQSIF